MDEIAFYTMGLMMKALKDSSVATQFCVVLMYSLEYFGVHFHSCTVKNRHKCQGCNDFMIESSDF